MMAFLRYGCVIALMGLFFCCKKSNGNYSRNYTATGLALQTDIRMFTSGHEVTDKTIINKYILGDNTFNLTFSSSLNSVINFSSADTATFASLPEKYSVVKNGSLYLFYSKDYRIMQGAPTFVKYSGGQITIPSGANFTAVASQDVKVANGDNNSLQLSVLVYKYSFAYYAAQGLVYNQYNEALNTGPTDTIAVKQYLLNLKATN